MELKIKLMTYEILYATKWCHIVYCLLSFCLFLCFAHYLGVMKSLEMTFLSKWSYHENGIYLSAIHSDEHHPLAAVHSRAFSWSVITSKRPITQMFNESDGSNLNVNLIPWQHVLIRKLGRYRLKCPLFQNSMVGPSSTTNNQARR